MRLTRALILIFLFLGAFSSHAQEALLKYAHELFNWQQYDEAITEYKRFEFLYPEHEQVGEAFYMTGMCHKQLNNWDAAVSSIKKSLFYANDSLKTRRKLEIASIYMAGQQFDMAEFEMLRLYHFSKDEIFKSELIFYLALCNLYKMNWGKAHQWFSTYYEKSNPAFLPSLDSIFYDVENLKLKSPQLAKWMSTFIPGSGQMYANDFRNGINALAINSITVFWLVHSMATLNYMDALTINTTLFTRYYKGNRLMAAHHTRMYNQQKRNQNMYQILQHILSCDPDLFQ